LRTGDCGCARLRVPLTHRAVTARVTRSGVEGIVRVRSARAGRSGGVSSKGVARLDSWPDRPIGTALKQSGHEVAAANGVDSAFRPVQTAAPSRCTVFQIGLKAFPSALRGGEWLGARALNQGAPRTCRHQDIRQVRDIVHQLERAIELFVLLAFTFAQLLKRPLQVAQVFGPGQLAGSNCRSCHAVPPVQSWSAIEAPNDEPVELPGGAAFPGAEVSVGEDERLA
jgi:hypothetical protein